jgi:hypothetical protein
MSNMPLSDLDQDITPIPRSREENQERYVLPDGGEGKKVIILTTTQSLYRCITAKGPQLRCSLGIC